MAENIVQCTSMLLRINPYINAPIGIPPLVIIQTIENVRDIYSLGVFLCISACTGTWINMIETLNRQRTPDSKEKYKSVSFPSWDKLKGNNNTENVSIMPMSILQPIIRDLITFSSLPNKRPTRILPSSAPNMIIICK